MATIQEYIDATKPNPDNYATPEEYDAAMADWVTSMNGPRAFAPSSTFTGPDGQTWYAAGSSNEATQGEYQANLLNNRMLGLMDGNGGVKDSQMARYNLLALNSRGAVRPDEMQAAYQAVTPGGTPALLPYLTNVLSGLGYGMTIPTVGDPASQDPGGTTVPGITPGTSGSDDPNAGKPGYIYVDGTWIPDMGISGGTTGGQTQADTIPGITPGTSGWNDPGAGQPGYIYVDGHWYPGQSIAGGTTGGQTQSPLSNQSTPAAALPPPSDDGSLTYTDNSLSQPPSDMTPPDMTPPWMKPGPQIANDPRYPSWLHNWMQKQKRQPGLPPVSPPQIGYQ